MKKPKPLESSGPRQCAGLTLFTTGPDVVRSSDTPLQARARSFVRHVITPTVAAAAETYPELSVTEILALCEPALTRDLTFELETARREAVSETFRRPQGRSPG